MKASPPELYCSSRCFRVADAFITIRAAIFCLRRMKSLQTLLSATLAGNIIPIRYLNQSPYGDYIWVVADNLVGLGFL